MPLPLVLAIEPDLRQAAIIKRIVRENALADVAVVDSLDAAIAAMRTAMPDVLLLSALLSPRDEDDLITHLKTLGNAGHLQTHTIPQLASALQPGEERGARGLLSAFRRKKGPAPVASGCDPDLFADEIKVFLQRAADKRRDMQNSNREMPDMRPSPAGAAPAVHERDDDSAAPSSSWSSPFEWKPASGANASAMSEGAKAGRAPRPSSAEAPSIEEPSTPVAESLMAHLRPPAGIPSVEALSATGADSAAPALDDAAMAPLDVLVPPAPAAVATDPGLAASSAPTFAAGASPASTELSSGGTEYVESRPVVESSVPVAEPPAAPVPAAAARAIDAVAQEVPSVVSRAREADAASTIEDGDVFAAAVSIAPDAPAIETEAAFADPDAIEGAASTIEARDVFAGYPAIAPDAAAIEAEAAFAAADAIERAASRIEVRDVFAGTAALASDAAATEAEAAFTAAAPIEFAASTIEVVSEVEEAATLEVPASRRRAATASIDLNESLGAVAPPQKRAPAAAAKSAQTSRTQKPAGSARPNGDSRLGIRHRSSASGDSRLGALATWARAEDRGSDEPASSDDLRALLTALSVPPAVVSVGYGRGCRIRRVRVPVSKEPQDSEVAGAVILSRRVLAEQRGRSTA